MSQHSPRHTHLTLIMVFAVIITALGLRPGATSVGPVLPEISEALTLSGTEAGLLTALPGLSFAVVGLRANWLTRRFGVVGSLLFASLLAMAGLGIRIFFDSWTLFLGFSALALAGMAVGNVVLPVFIKAHFPRRSAALATVYTTFLAIGSVLPLALSGLVVTLAEGHAPTGQEWRASLGIWAAFSTVAAAVWLLLLVTRPGMRQPPTLAARSVPLRALWRSPTAVALMLFFGLQSMQAYIQFGWIPVAFRAGGLDPSTAALMGAIIAVGGIPGGLLMPRLVARGRAALRLAIVTFGVLLACGYLGVAFLPTTTPWLWAVFLAVAGFAFPTALALVLERTKAPATTAALSGFVQPVGYLLAAAGPLMVGTASAAVPTWTPILLVLAATSIPFVATGLLATRPRYVDEEITH